MICAHLFSMQLNELPVSYHMHHEIHLKLQEHVSGYLLHVIMVSRPSNDVV